MKRAIIAILAMVGMLSCATDTTKVNTTISGRFVGSGVDTIYLERMSDNFSQPESVAAACLEDNGAFHFELAIEEGTSPRFYRISNKNGGRPVTLVVAPEDNITLESAGDIFLNYTVEGSEESALIREFNRDYFASCDKLAHVAEHLGTGVAYSKREAYRLASEAIKSQVRFVATHPNSLAAFYAMRHNVAERYIPQLDGYGVTILHYRTVLEGITAAYPDSPYIAILESEIAHMEAMIELVDNAKLVSYPDIELEDMYKTKHKLSSLEGKVVLLYFWTYESARCNNINAELKELYKKYNSKGFEVYHISADSDEALWIDVVRQQKHPWISVFGGGGVDVFSLYNVVTLPTAYLIDRKGNMSVAPLNISALERAIEEAL